MPRVTIDNREIDVPAGSTVLDAARRLGIDVPVLCWYEGLPPNTSCMACLVKVSGRQAGPEAQGHAETERLVPACATVVGEGMLVESETPEVHRARKASLELLLSDHAGDCRAPCQYACPFDSDVPRMIRAIAAGRIEEAIVALRQDVPLAAVLARLGPDACEAACQRANVDQAAAIGLLRRYVAEKDIATEAPYTPPRRPLTGERIAIVGAGPAGLSAAYFLLQAGYACTLLDARPQAGGSLLDVPAAQLPTELLIAEVAALQRLGADLRLGTRVHAAAFAAVQREFDAVLVAAGELTADEAAVFGLPDAISVPRSARVTPRTPLPNVFVAGSAAIPRRRAAQAAADGKTAAVCIGQFLRGERVVGRGRLATLRLAQPRGAELAVLASEASSADRVIPSGGQAAGLTDEEAWAESERCLHCDCRGLHDCKLRKYAEMYGAAAQHFRGQRRQGPRPTGHPEIIFDPGKCILCGICVQITQSAGERLGLAYVGRGFDVRIGVPFDGSLGAALRATGGECVDACPTGALAWHHEAGRGAGCDQPGCGNAAASGAAPGTPDPKQ